MKRLLHYNILVLAYRSPLKDTLNFNTKVLRFVQIRHSNLDYIKHYREQKDFFFKTNLYKSRDDCLNSLTDDLEAVSIIQSHDVGAHECEDGHDVVKNLLLKSESKTVTTAFECTCLSVSWLYLQGRCLPKHRAEAVHDGEFGACLTSWRTALPAPR